MINKILFYLFVILFFSNLYSEASPSNLKVMIDVNSFGMKEDESNLIKEFFINEVNRLSQNKIYTKEQVRKIAAAKKIKLNLQDLDSEKLLKVADKIGFNYLILMTISKTAKQYQIMIKRHSIQENTYKIFSSQIRDEFELYDLLEIIAERVTQASGSKKAMETIELCPAPSIITDHINLKLTSDPEGAEISIDDVFYGETPKLIEDISIGLHVLKLSSKYCHDLTKTIEITEVDCNVLHFDMNKKKTGTIKVMADISGAVVYLDGLYMGKAPKYFRNIEYGKHLVSVHNNFSYPHQESFEITNDSIKTIMAFLNKPTPITINGEPKGAKIHLNGDLLGFLPINKYTLNPGFYEAKIIMSGYESYQFSITTDSFEPLEYSVQLKPKSRSKALKYSMLFPGIGQLYSDRKYGLLYGFLTVGNVYFLISSNSKLNHLITEYNDLKEDYRKSIDSNLFDKFHTQIDSKYEKIVKIEKRRNQFIATTIGVWLWNLVDTVIFWPYNNVQVHTSCSFLNHPVVSLGVSFQFNNYGGGR